VQATATPLSMEHVVLVGDPVAAHAKLALVEVVVVCGVEVSDTVGADPVGGGDVIVQVYVAELLPNAFETVTLNECDVAPSEL
jgi:hypothetical protein